MDHSRQEWYTADETREHTLEGGDALRSLPWREAGAPNGGREGGGLLSHVRGVGGGFISPAVHSVQRVSNYFNHLK